MEQELIIQKCNNLFAGVDARDWNRVKATMDKQVLLDYSSMSGHPAATLNAQDIIDSWSSFLPGFDSTQHRIGGFVVKVEGNTATAHLDGTANHYIDSEVWTVEGNYDVKLVLTGNEWLIREFRFNFLKQSGNMDLPKRATERMSAKQK
ncbi:nuclear transport factor 2 family protein [Longitalea arenae]|uniref:nuclear transport factor 2 family protein n=1 Tax=Longitalea arenae TaxID=2812558 RepID=UPI0019674FD5|nr:nuclear transport factor 2 family protein [Longitalea arenae]